MRAPIESGMSISSPKRGHSSSMKSPSKRTLAEQRSSKASNKKMETE